MHSEKIDVHNLSEVLDLIQCSSACHQKYAIILKKALDKGDDELFKKLCAGLQLAFLTNHTEKNPYVARIVDFIALLASFFNLKQNDENENYTILHRILKFVLLLSQSGNDGHRFWSCTLFNKIFQNLEELSEEICEEVLDSMLVRLKDSKAVIRCQAIIALHRLQDPNNDQDVIISEMCTLLNSDFNAKVRQLCLEKIALNKRVLPIILDRITDVDSNVRLSAFKKLQLVAKYLKVTQKRLVLQCGLCDSFDKIRQFTRTELLESWLQTYNNDYIKLMKSIRLDACEEDIKMTAHLAELVLQALFKGAPIDNITRPLNINEKKLINYEDLNWETVLYYRISVQFLRQSDAFEENLDQILPELIPFCEYIKNYCHVTKTKDNLEDLQHQFILQQMFLIAKGYDVSDSTNRKSFTSLVYFVLTNENLSTDTTEIVVSNLEKTITSVNGRSIFVCEIISNILHGEENIDYKEMERKELERSHCISQLQSDINSLHDQEKHFAFVEKNLSEAARVQQEILRKEEHLREVRDVREKPEQSEKKTDVATMLKALNVATGLLLSPTINRFNPAISTLHSETISPALMYDNQRVVAKALRCYALCCVIDKTTARYGIHIFSGILFSGDADVDVVLISLKVIVDLIGIYGLSLIEKRDEEEGEASDSNHEQGEASDSRREEGKKVFVGGTSLSDLIQALADYLEHEDLQVQSVATRGVCILLLSRRITSSSLLSRIIIKWANPATDESKLKQFIGKTLNKLVALDNCQTYFGNAVTTTISTIVYAPTKSPLADIDIDNLIKFMVTLCEMPSQGKQIQTTLAYKMCDTMLEHPKRKVNFYYSKTLPLLNIPDDARDELLAKCDELRDVIRDSSTLKNINKFNTNLTKTSQKLVPIQEAQGEEELV